MSSGNRLLITAILIGVQITPWSVRPARGQDSPVQSAMPAKSATSKAETRFTSFEEALKALDPIGGYEAELALRPMTLKGKVLVLRLAVTQVLGDGSMLLSTGFYTGYPEVDSKVYFGHVTKAYAGSREFVDGQSVAVVGEVTGTYQYTTTLGALKTVPLLTIYGIR